MTEIPQKDKEIIEQFAFSMSETLHETLIESLATVYKKGVLAERKTIIDRILEIIDDEISSWERIREEVGYEPQDDNAEAALALARSRIAELTEGGE